MQLKYSCRKYFGKCFATTFGYLTPLLFISNLYNIQLKSQNLDRKIYFISNPTPEVSVLESILINK